MGGIVPPTPPLSTSEPSITNGGRLPAQGEAAAYMHPRPWQWWGLKILYSWCSAPVSIFCLWFIRLSDQMLHLGGLFQPVIICHNEKHLTFARIETGLVMFRAGSNRYPIPACCLTFCLIPNPTKSSFENHRVSGNLEFRHFESTRNIGSTLNTWNTWKYPTYPEIPESK